MRVLREVYVRTYNKQYLERALIGESVLHDETVARMVLDAVRPGHAGDLRLHHDALTLREKARAALEDRAIVAELVVKFGIENVVPTCVAHSDVAGFVGEALPPGSPLRRHWTPATAVEWLARIYSSPDLCAMFLKWLAARGSEQPRCVSDAALLGGEYCMVQQAGALSDTAEKGEVAPLVSGTHAGVERPVECREPSTDRSTDTCQSLSTGDDHPRAYLAFLRKPAVSLWHSISHSTHSLSELHWPAFLRPRTNKGVTVRHEVHTDENWTTASNALVTENAANESPAHPKGAEDASLELNRSHGSIRHLVYLHPTTHPVTCRWLDRCRAASESGATRLGGFAPDRDGTGNSAAHKAAEDESNARTWDEVFDAQCSGEGYHPCPCESPDRCLPDELVPRVTTMRRLASNHRRHHRSKAPRGDTCPPSDNTESAVERHCLHESHLDSSTSSASHKVMMFLFGHGHRHGQAPCSARPRVAALASSQTHCSAIESHTHCGTETGSLPVGRARPNGPSAGQRCEAARRASLHGEARRRCREEKAGSHETPALLQRLSAGLSSVVHALEHVHLSSHANDTRCDDELSGDADGPVPHRRIHIESRTDLSLTRTVRVVDRGPNSLAVPLRDVLLQHDFILHAAIAASAVEVRCESPSSIGQGGVVELRSTVAPVAFRTALRELLHSAPRSLANRPIGVAPASQRRHRAGRACAEPTVAGGTRQRGGSTGRGRRSDQCPRDGRLRTQSVVRGGPAPCDAADDEWDQLGASYLQVLGACAPTLALGATLPRTLARMTRLVEFVSAFLRNSPYLVDDYEVIETRDGVTFAAALAYTTDLLELAPDDASSLCETGDDARCSEPEVQGERGAARPAASGRAATLLTAAAVHAFDLVPREGPGCDTVTSTDELVECLLRLWLHRFHSTVCDEYAEGDAIHQRMAAQHLHLVSLATEGQFHFYQLDLNECTVDPAQRTDECDDAPVFCAVADGLTALACVGDQWGDHLAPVCVSDFRRATFDDGRAWSLVTERFAEAAQGHSIDAPATLRRARAAYLRNARAALDRGGGRRADVAAERVAFLNQLAAEAQVLQLLPRGEYRFALIASDQSGGDNCDRGALCAVACEARLERVEWTLEHGLRVECGDGTPGSRQRRIATPGAPSVAPRLLRRLRSLVWVTCLGTDVPRDNSPSAAVRDADVHRVARVFGSIVTPMLAADMAEVARTLFPRKHVGRPAGDSASALRAATRPLLIGGADDECEYDTRFSDATDLIHFLPFETASDCRESASRVLDASAPCDLSRLCYGQESRARPGVSASCPTPGVSVKRDAGNLGTSLPPPANESERVCATECHLPPRRPARHEDLTTEGPTRCWPTAHRGGGPDRN